MVLDISNCLFGKTMVPIAETCDADSLEYILHLTGITSLFVSEVACKGLLKINNKHNLKKLISFDTLEPSLEGQLKEKGYELITYKSVLESG